MAARIIVARARHRDGHSGPVETSQRGIVVAPGPAEGGCLLHGLRRKAEEASSLVILDGWRDRAAFEAHAARAPVALTWEKPAPLLAKPLGITQMEQMS